MGPSPWSFLMTRPLAFCRIETLYATDETVRMTAGRTPIRLSAAGLVRSAGPCTSAVRRSFQHIGNCSTIGAYGAEGDRAAGDFPGVEYDAGLLQPIFKSAVDSNPADALTRPSRG